MFFRSLTAKTLAVYLPLALAAVVAVFAVQSWMYHQEQERELIEQLHSLASVQSSSLAQAVWEFDTDVVLGSLEQLMELPIVRDAVVLDDTGNPIAALGLHDHPPEKPSYRHGRDIVYVENNVRHVVGKVVVGVTGRDIDTRQRDTLVVNLVVLASLLVALTSAALISNRRFIGRPLALLKQAIESQDRHRGEPVPIDWRSGDELGLVVDAFDRMRASQHRNDQRIRDYQTHLEDLVQERTAELHASIKYAGRIQRSILPAPQVLEKAMKEWTVLWEPRDMVGGDLYWCRRWGAGYVVMLGDCTGHGVPGALMTLVCSGVLDRAENETDPGNLVELTRRIHQLTRNALAQNTDSPETDDGMELGLCFIPDHRRHLDFVGARIDLFVVENGAVTRVVGAKKGIGYPEVPDDQEYPAHRLDALPGRSFYMASDGILDQVGGPDRVMFGRRRFQELLLRVSGLPMEKQAGAAHDELLDYQRGEPRRDDVSLLGFRLA